MFKQRVHNRAGINLFSGIDYGFIAIYLALVAIGLIAVISATWKGDSVATFALSNEYVKHMIYIGLSLAIAFVILLCDSSIWHKYAYLFYVASLLLALTTLLPGIGLERNGARAWIGLGGFTLQPIEFAMVGLALGIARLMGEYSFSTERLSSLMQVAMIILPIFVVVKLQNDFGTGLIACSLLLMLFREGLNLWICILIICVVVLFFLSMLLEPTPLLIVIIVLFTIVSAILMRQRWKVVVKYSSGLFFISTILYAAYMLIAKGDNSDNNIYYLFLLGTTIVSLPVVIWLVYRANIRELYLMIALFVVSIAVLPTSNMLYNSLHGYQKGRIDTYLGLSEDRNATYNVNQSKIAIGSGGWTGKGYLQGTQIRYKMVPERHTDFIFCTICEEFGLLGAAVLFVLYAFFILRLMSMGDNQQDRFGRVYCYSAASILTYHAFVNIGFTMGFMPVMGITLPLISYGGSSLLATTIMVFIAVAIDASTRRALPVYRKW